jgi:hypothetical protein
MKDGKKKREAKAEKSEPSKAAQSKNKLTFSDAVAAAPPPVAAALRKSKQALSRAHRAQVMCKDEARWTGSIELDEALKKEPEQATANRWDYGLGYKNPDGLESALWVEVHSAETGEVSTVIKKLNWLKGYLPANCPELWALTLKTPENLRFVWVASGRFAILPNSPQMRALRPAGLDPPIPRLLVP